MSCKPDLNTLVEEIEWLVKDHSWHGAQCAERLRSCSNPITMCKDDSYTMKITLDIFVKLQQMLHNYIGLMNFRGSRPRDYDDVKIPLSEALDVAMRAMISAMHSSITKQPPSTPVCLNCARTSGCTGRQFVNRASKCEYEKLPEIEEVDNKLQGLKEITMGSFGDLEICIKGILRAIARLPCAAVASRLEILSSVVRNMKNKLMSCGQPGAASLMGQQVNPISQIISEFIVEYGQIKSQIFPCRKVCRFCDSLVCLMDRQRDVFCCEKAKQLNFLWKQWMRQNTVKGVAKWDEDTIASIVDSFKGGSVDGNRCQPDGPCANLCRSGQQGLKLADDQDGQGNAEKILRGNVECGQNRSKTLADSVRIGNDRREVDSGPRGPRSRVDESRTKVGGGRDSKDRFEPGRTRDRKGRELRRHSLTSRNDGAKLGAGESSDVDKKKRKKGSKKGGAEGDLSIEDESQGIEGCKKGTKKNERGGSDRERAEGDDPADKRRGKSYRKKEGDPVDDSGDRETGSGDKPGGPESGRKRREGKNDKHRQELDDDAASSSRNRKGDQTGSEGGGSKGGRSGKTEDGENIIEYRRSNKLFIELGWTILPKDTIMRRVVEFETEPAKPRMNWFKNNRMYGKQYYTDGNTVFLNFLEDGTGHVYYPDGKIAIVAHISKEETHETYKVYSEGGRDLMGVVRAPWLMGVFDSMGNGVVYDENCKVRHGCVLLSYNQNGGVFPENPSKVPFSWNWNNFQAPPIDQVVREGDPNNASPADRQPKLHLICIECHRCNEPPTVRLPPELVSAKEPTNSGSKSSKRSKSSKVTSCWKLSESGNMALNQKSEMIEPSNVIERKVIAPLKPICLKMNKYLSLRILDRKNINLQFFAGPKSIRIELGTEVNPNVQINSELVDRNDWTAKMTKSKYDVDSNLAKVDPSKVEDSLVEIAKEIERVKTEANSRRLMIAKYRPHLIDKSS